MAPLSLSQLLDVAIGTPEIGAVNFRALYSLLQAVLGHLGVQDLPAPGHDQPPKAPLREEGAQGRGPGTELLTPSKDPLQGTVSTPHDASMAADMGQMKRKIEENKSSVSKDIALSQDLLEEIGRMKAAQSRIEEDVRTIQETLGMGNLQDAAGQLLALRDQTALDSDVQKLKERLSLYPAPEEVSNMVRWEVLEDCLVGSKAGEGEGGGEEEEEGRGLSLVSAGASQLWEQD
ncbi:uncharacterized protein LOC113486682 isoform X3 [Athene cunicularia]|uniref:uncharacterized protein LOC113486682 isoform X3 n=1 Tax=Athene cunicularia TaxID=194338 RepID=UPI000EF65D65|nr:uncharacterized protein LOC113486682 isoform X3 [Athene cunicularia]